jgi:phosphatidylglycerol:prolipoprotein diacylglycerol transferase
MKPILFRFADGSYIHSGHFLLFVGGLAGIALLAWDLRRTRERPEEIYGLLLVLFVSTLLGARILYCIDFQDKYGYGLADVLKFWKGGLALHGGALLGFAAYVLYTGWRRLDFWRTGDLLTPPAAAFVFFARIGCILVGCCYGEQCNPGFPLAMTFTSPSTMALKNVPLYPTQALFALSAAVVFAVTWRLRKRKRFDGETALVGTALFSLLAFAVEFLRGDLRVLYSLGGIILSQNQVLNALIFLAAVHLYIYRRTETRGLPNVTRPAP